MGRALLLSHTHTICVCFRGRLFSLLCAAGSFRCCLLQMHAHDFRVARTACAPSIALLAPLAEPKAASSCAPP